MYLPKSYIAEKVGSKKRKFRKARLSHLVDLLMLKLKLECSGIIVDFNKSFLILFVKILLSFIPKEGVGSSSTF